jgi:hypothetical protein
MIVFITTRGHSNTVKSLFKRSFDFDLPLVRALSYDELFFARTVSSATYIFTDIERLSPPELQLAADLYRSLGELGFKRLNDPAFVLSRFALLRNLYQKGFNPFNAYRADDEPKPTRFPVILRREFDHDSPHRTLIHSQEELDRWLNETRSNGMPLRGWLVIEFCGEPISPGIWRKFGTFRIGEAMHVDHGVVEDNWCAKHGTPGLASEGIIRETCGSIETNEFADAIRPAFEIGKIEYGRADHAVVGGRHVVYEINTNPMIRGPRVSRSHLYTEALTFSRERLAKLIWRIDSEDGRSVRLPRSSRLQKCRRSHLWSPSPIRP